MKNFNLRKYLKNNILLESVDRVYSGDDKDTFKSNEDNILWVAEIMADITLELGEMGESAVDEILKRYDEGGRFKDSVDSRGIHRTELYSLADHFVNDVKGPAGHIDDPQIEQFVDDVLSGKYASHPSEYPEDNDI